MDEERKKKKKIGTGRDWGGYTYKLTWDVQARDAKICSSRHCSLSLGECLPCLLVTNPRMEKVDVSGSEGTRKRGKAREDSKHLRLQFPESN